MSGPKIAFCFMSYGDVEQRRIWEGFFANVSSEQYVNLIHRTDKVTTTWLPNATVIPHRKTAYAEFSLVEVQQDLFIAATADPSVTKCVLLSGDSIPIYSFSYIYAKLTADEKGYITDYKQTGNKYEDSANRKAWPANMPWEWRLAHQWVVLNRDHIQLVRDHWEMLKNVFGPSKVPDEHVYIILFKALGKLDTFHVVCAMVTNWKQPSSSCFMRHRKIPRTHHTNDFTQPYVDWIYEQGGFFMRKICMNSQITMNWTEEKPIVTVKGRPPPPKPFYGRAYFYRNH